MRIWLTGGRGFVGSHLRDVFAAMPVDLGEIRLPGQVSEESMDARLTWSRITAEDAPTLTVDLSVGLGEIEVRS